MKNTKKQENINKIVQRVIDILESYERESKPFPSSNDMIVEAALDILKKFFNL